MIAVVVQSVPANVGESVAEHPAVSVHTATAIAPVVMVTDASVGSAVTTARAVKAIGVRGTAPSVEVGLGVIVSDGILCAAMTGRGRRARLRLKNPSTLRSMRTSSPNSSIALHVGNSLV